VLLKSLNYWSVPGGLEGTLDPIDFLKICADNGFEAAEIAIGDVGSAFGIDATQARCQEIVAAASQLGLKLPTTASGLYWGRNLADADPALRQQALDDLKKMLQIAAWLGAKTHLTIPGAVDVFFLPDRVALPYAHVWQHASEGIGSAIPTAEACGVRIGIENVWNRFLLSPKEMSDFVDQFASPWVGAYVDVANLLPFGYAEDWLRHLGKRVVGIHFKDFRRAVGTAEGFVDLLEGDVNWPEVMKAIAEIGFEGAVTAELIPLYKHYPLVRVANTSRAMDAILGS
ncbi:MAG: sugar phosphate isomerase/epimerase family protein, partial [Fimbriimonadaceae bacterium]